MAGDVCVARAVAAARGVGLGDIRAAGLGGGVMGVGAAKLTDSVHDSAAATAHRAARGVVLMLSSTRKKAGRSGPLF